MHKRTPLLEWQFVENQAGQGEASWPPAVNTTPSAPADQRHPYRQYVWGGVLALLLLLTGGGWLWHTAQAGLDQIEGELSSTVQIELASVTPVPTPLEINWTTDAAGGAWKAS
jgi:hypothetical protein